MRSNICLSIFNMPFDFFQTSYIFLVHFLGPYSKDFFRLRMMKEEVNEESTDVWGKISVFLLSFLVKVVFFYLNTIKRYFLFKIVRLKRLCGNSLDNWFLRLFFFRRQVFVTFYLRGLNRGLTLTGIIWNSRILRDWIWGSKF